ncbi:MAG TPA: hypothetical protein VFC29_00805 [Candidatus Limnocylindrales bacterium]|nr:hypothetical protein [Candidatus Limnocylindrales bacterium]
MTTKLNIVDSATASRSGIDEGSEAQRKERATDKTLADSFPASDPPSWHS